MGIGGGVFASPPYPVSHSGPVLVCGNAACLLYDVERARKLVGDVSVIAVNGAAKVIKADHLYSKHHERFITFRWIDAQQFHYGKGFTVHADLKALNKSKKVDCVDHWWKGIWGGGGSAWDARKLAYYLGFDPVILCGCPLEPGPYINGGGIGGYMTSVEIVEELSVELEKDTEWHKGAYSMNGRTREILGQPK